MNNLSSLNTLNSFSYQATITNTLTYNEVFDKHHIDVLLGHEFVDFYNENFSASRKDFLYETNNFRYLNYGTSDQLNAGTAYQWRLNSFFGQASYNYDDKYLFTGTLRSDGTSRLSNHKHGLFPAFSLGWRLDRENFFDNLRGFMTFMIRGGWGRTGNQEIPPYSTVDSFTNYVYTSNYPIDGSQTSVTPGLTQSRNANTDLHWETTDQTSAGIDMTFFNRKLGLSIDAYRKVTSDILVFADVPLTNGGTSDGMWRNDGKMTNKGLELAATYHDRIGELGINLMANYTYSKNKLTELNSVSFIGIPSGILHDINFDQEVSRTMVGYPIGAFYGYVVDGIFKSNEEVSNYGMQPSARPGDFRFKDINNDGKVDSEDRTFIGSPLPKSMLGLSVNLDYKNFNLSLFFNGQFGNKIYNMTKFRSLFFNLSAYNKEEGIKGAWTPENPNSEIPRLTTDDPNNNIRPSSFYVENGSYFRLNNMTLGYTFNQKAFQNMKLRLFTQLTNVFTITKYSGMTPEIGLQNYSSDNRNLDIGIDRGVYPPSRTFTVGLQLNY